MNELQYHHWPLVVLLLKHSREENKPAERSRLVLFSDVKTVALQVRFPCSYARTLGLRPLTIVAPFL